MLAERAVGLNLHAREHEAVLHFLQFQHLHARFVEENFFGVGKSGAVELQLNLGAALHPVGRGALQRGSDGPGDKRGGGEEGEGEGAGVHAEVQCSVIGVQ